MRRELREESVSGSAKTKLRVMFLAFSLLALGSPCGAQQARGIPRIGYLTTTFASEAKARVDTLRRGLQQLGYLEGNNIVIEPRYGDGKPDQLPRLVNELIDL